MNILFIGADNQWQSKTAKDIFKYHNRVTAKAATLKTNPTAFDKQIDWAELIFVLDNTALNKLGRTINDEKTIVNLNVPETYDYMHPELVALLKASVFEYLN